MLAIARKNKIKDILNEYKSITVTELSNNFNVTEETIRRDLKTLEDEGFLSRTYGGAFIQSGAENNVDISLREVAYVDSKTAIATMCKNLIHNGDSIFLDCSTSANFVARAITHKRLTVVTNSLLIVDNLSGYDNIKLVVVGGTLNKEHKAFVGSVALASLDELYVDKIFMSSRSISLSNRLHRSP